jgi:hypothetical protein
MSTRLTGLVLLLLPLAGCQAALVPPVHEIEDDQSMVVIPFADPDFPDRWQSPRGHDLAMRTTEMLGQSVDFRICSYDKVLGLAGKPDASRLRPGDIAAQTNSDYVLICQVVQFQLRDPLNINMKQGLARVKVRLYQADAPKESHDARDRQRDDEQEAARTRLHLAPMGAERGARFVREDEVEAKWPTDFLDQYGEINLEDEQIQAELIVATARKIAKLYTEHEREHESIQ